MKNSFAPPTKEEIEAASAKPSFFDPPSKEELAAATQPMAAPGANAKSSEDSNMLGAALQGFGNGASFGYLPQLQAMGEGPATEWINQMAKHKWTADLLGIPHNAVVEPDDYVKSRDGFIKNQKDIAEKNPGSFLAGNIGGGLASGIATAGLGPQAQAATLLGRVGQAAATGAAIGAVSNPGDTEGEISPVQPVDRFKNALTGGALGGVLQGGLEGVSKAVTPLASKLSELTKPATKSAIDKIMEAAEALGIKPTPGMLATRGGYVERMEDSLADSPSIFGAAVRKNQNKVQSALQNTTNDLGAEATSLTPFQVGDNFKAGLSKKITDRADTAGSIFEDVANSTKHIPISQKSTDAVGRNIENNDLFKLLPGGKPQQYRDMLGRLENANQAKQMLTLLNSDIASSEGAEKQVLLAIKDKVQNLEKNSITRAAISSARTKGEGNQAALDMIDDLKSARGQWQEIHQDMAAVGKPAGMKFGGPSDFTSKLDSIPSQSIQDKFLNPNKLEAVNALKEKFPEQFELLRQGKLRDIMDSAVYKGETSAQSFIKQVNKFDPEFQAQIFGDQAPKIQQMNTLIDSLPKKFNPSGTSGQSMFSRDALYSHAGDLPRYLSYKAASSNGIRDAVSGGAQAVASGASALNQAPSLIGALPAAQLNGDRPFDKTVVEPGFEQNPKLLDLLGKKPEMLDQIKNPQLREAIRKQMPQQAPQKDPRQSFIEGN